MPTIIQLRSESKPHERRSALTPTTAKALLEAGYKVRIERSQGRIFKDEEFSAVGAELVPEGSWPRTPTEDTIILGLKELPEDDPFPLKHTHVQFAHCFKGQSNWEEVLARFPRGGGTLLDLEFLVDDRGRRVAAFGYHAGYAGAAIAIMVWAWQTQHPDEIMPGINDYEAESLLVDDVRARLRQGMEKNKTGQQAPRVIVIGAKGRCGSGALDLLRAVGIPSSNLLEWDLDETARGGPFMEIVESDIFINCIFLSEKIPPFVDMDILASPTRRLSVVCDVSCDYTSTLNPVPIYHSSTTFDRPTVSVPVKPTSSSPLSVIAIDHLPSLLPREASEAFSAALIPSLLSLDKRAQTPVWQRAQELFQAKVAELPKGMVS